MMNLKKELEDAKMKTVQEIITKAIEEKMELKIDENLETNLNNFTILDDEFWEYVDLLSTLLSYSQMILSKTELRNYYSTLEKCDFTKNDFFLYLTLTGKLWKVLDENVMDKEFVRNAHFRHLEDDFDDFMTDNRKKVFEFNFDQTDVWKELEPRIKNGIGKKKYSQITPNKNWKNSIKFEKKEKPDIRKEKPIFKEILYSMIPDKTKEQFDAEIDWLKKHEKNNVEQPPSPIGLKRGLASAIGITICSKCGTRTKIEKPEEIAGIKFGYAECPKCGHKEKWMYGHP